MKCKHCGEEIDNDSKFCEFCGAKVKKRMPWWGILLIVLGVAGGSFLIGQYSHGNDHSGETTEEPVKEVAEEAPATPAGYVDLGLSVYWKDGNECNPSDDHGFYTYDDAMRSFGSTLPTMEQWEELRTKCTWTWMGDSYRVTGPNGNSIFLPAAGFRNCEGYVFDVGTYGNYWSSTTHSGSVDAWGRSWSLYFHSSGGSMGGIYRCSGLSVRLVQGK